MQCGWHYITPCMARAIGDERGRAAGLRVIKMRSQSSHYAYQGHRQFPKIPVTKK